MTERKKQIEKYAWENVPDGEVEPFIRGALWSDAIPPAPSGDDERDAEVETRKWARSCRKLMGYKNGTMRISEDDYKAGFLAGRRSCKCRT